MTYPHRNASDFAAVVGVVRDYFEALHRGDVAGLARLFDDEAWLQTHGARRTRDEWLEAVKNRTSPEDRGDAFEYRLLSVDISGEQAMVKASVPLLGSRFVDYLGLLREGGEWRIVNKMYADDSPTSSTPDASQDKPA